jgi:hypothetical protein
MRRTSVGGIDIVPKLFARKVVQAQDLRLGLPARKAGA